MSKVAGLEIRSLSKDHNGNTMPTGAEMVPFVRIKNLKNGQPYPVAHSHKAYATDS